MHRALLAELAQLRVRVADEPDAEESVLRRERVVGVGADLGAVYLRARGVAGAHRPPQMLSRLHDPTGRDVHQC